MKRGHQNQRHLQTVREEWLPIDGSPVGLVSWYGPGGPVAVLTSWLAVVNGSPPALRAGCSSRLPEGTLFPAGTDFAVNVPADGQLPELRELLRGVAVGVPLPLDATLGLHPARSVHAPLLAGCALQIECARGRLLPGEWAPELLGDILLLHRGGLFLDPADHPDFCALRPLRTCFPS